MADDNNASRESHREDPDDFQKRLDALTPEAAKLSYAVAILRRITRLWTIVAGHPYIAVRGEGDEHAYQTLRHELIKQFSDSGAFQDLRHLMDDLPAALPTSNELIAFDDLIRSDFESLFQRIEAAIFREAASRDLLLDSPLYDIMFAQADAELNTHEINARRQRNQMLRRLGFDKSPSPPPSDLGTSKSPNTKRGGRPRIDIPYETIRRLRYVALQLALEDFGEKGERDQTPQVTNLIIRDLYIKLTGTSVSVETIENRIAEWKSKKYKWPPKPLTEDEIEQLEPEYLKLLE
jgi:hypothetical protein